MSLTTESAAELPQTAPAAGARVLTEQLAAYAAELRALSPADWSRHTDCTGWDVRQIAAHVAGALEEGAFLRVQFRHMRAARQAMRTTQVAMVDALNAEQLADRVAATPEQLLSEIDRLAPKAARKRMKTPGLVRRHAVPGNDLPPGSSFAYLFDVIYQRDVWMHRIDTARATGRDVAPCGSDTEVVAQVMRDLSTSWTRTPVTVELTGLGAGQWLLGNGEPAAHVRTDSTEYLRLLSGRPADPALSIDGDETVGAALTAARVVF